MARRHFSRPVYEGLPWFYISFGIVALIASYLLAARGALSLTVGLLGFLTLRRGGSGGGVPPGCRVAERDAARCRVGEGATAARRTLVHVDQFMLADQDDIAVVQVMAAHASGLHVDPVGAVQVLDVARMGRGDHLAVMTADEAAVDLHVIVGRAADDDPPDP